MNGIGQVTYVVKFTGWRSDGVTAKFEFLASGHTATRLAHHEKEFLLKTERETRPEKEKINF